MTHRHPFIAFAPTLVLATAACAETAPVPQVAPPPSVVAPAPAPPSALPDPFLHVKLQPRIDPTKSIHVDIELASAGPLGTFRLLRGAPEALSHVALSDTQGTIDAKVTADGEGVLLTPARAPSGVMRLAYDIAGNAESPFDPLAERVQDDRFVGSGEGLLLLPDGLDDQAVPIDLVLDGGPLRAPNGASTWGLGATRRTNARPRVLRHLAFVVGSLGGAIFDTAGEHDESAWLGYTAFDPRPAAAEVAQIRSAMGELFHDHEQAPVTLLFVTQTRPLGSYSTTPRSGGVLLQLGPSEPWSAALRLSIAQQLVRPWLGGQLWIGTRDAQTAAASYWFTEGVARFFATRLLARLGLMKPDEVRDAFAGETGVILASHHRGESNAALAALASKDDVARAHLAARGALYAARVNALLREKSKGALSLDGMILDLLAQARKSGQALPLSAWTDALDAALGPAEHEAFTRMVGRGEEVVLPKGVLGHCYRSGAGEYVAFDLGFDADATRLGKLGEVVGLEAKGPAARAGLRAGDVLVETDYRDGHSEVPVALTVKRGSETLHLKYAPKGETHAGPTWTRVPGLADEQCGDAW